MSFSDYETSRANGQPVELYEFRYGDAPADIIRLTSADEDIIVGADTYAAIAIERDGFSEDGDPDDSATLSLTLPHANALADLYRIQPPEKTVTVKLRVMHRNDPAQQITALWSGRVVGVAWEYPEMTVALERISTSLKRTGVRARYQRQCRHVHYGAGCRLNRVDFETTGEVLAMPSTTQVQVAEAAGFADGYFTGGFIDVAGALRLIIGHAGDLLTINRQLDDLAVGATVKAYPGCDRSAATCDAKFANVDNYGGFDFIPGKGPFEGSSLV
ncbi:MAG: phage BR0599 family protein [Halomonas sp.]|nr:phage BR0599 family protein [Halomonas sp.]